METKAQLNAWDAVAQTLAQHGGTHGVSDVTSECDHKTGEIIFRQGGQLWVIRSKDVEEFDE